jgi:Zn-dependent protease
MKSWACDERIHLCCEPRAAFARAVVRAIATAGHDACTDEAPMTRRVRLGHIVGVDVTVDWSWVITFALAAWTLFSVADRLMVAGRPGDLVVLSAAAAIGLFASLVVHEVAHALAARACGVPVRRLTLFLFGGITDVERDPASPHTEMVAALVAPLTNALLGGALLGLAVTLESRTTGTSGAGPVFGFLVLWLGFVNVAIAAWNLVPAFPLDGGRLVRAAIWRATGDIERATRWAAWGGQLVGWLLVLLGVALAIGTHGLGVTGGMWLAFVGWFLASAAAQAYEGIVAQAALAGVTVERLMRRRPEVVAAELGPKVLVARPSDDAARTHATLVDRDIDRLPVVDGGLLVGVVERRDVEQWISTHATRAAVA